MDGGTVWNINVSSAVKQCLDMGFEQSDIIVDVAICGYTEPTAEQAAGNAVQNWLHAYQVRGAHNGMNAVGEQERAFPDVEYRYYFQD